MVKYNGGEYMYSQICINRSSLGQKKKWSDKTSDLLKEVQFI